MDPNVMHDAQLDDYLGRILDIVIASKSVPFL